MSDKYLFDKYKWGSSGLEYKTKGPKMSDEFELFKESDCDVRYPTMAALCGAMVEQFTEGISLDKANAKVREWLAKGVRVTASSLLSPDGWRADHADCSSCKIEGILVNVRPIEPEDSTERVLADFIDDYERFSEQHGGMQIEKLYHRARKLLSKQQQPKGTK